MAIVITNDMKPAKTTKMYLLILKYGQINTCALLKKERG